MPPGPVEEVERAPEFSLPVSAARCCCRNVPVLFQRSSGGSHPNVLQGLIYNIATPHHSALCLQGRALLHWACDRGHKELVSLLLQHKADINSQVGRVLFFFILGLPEVVKRNCQNSGLGSLEKIQPWQLCFVFLAQSRFFSWCLLR